MITKRFSFFGVLLFAALLYAGCEEAGPVAVDNVATTLNSAQKGASVSAFSPQAIEGEYLVVLKETALANDVGTRAREIAAAQGGEVLYVYRHVLNGFALKMPAASVQAVAALADVDYVEQSQFARGSSVAVADTQFGAPWGLDRIDQRPLPLNGRYGYSLSGDGVTAYVIDSGMDLDHPQFGGRASLGADLVDPLEGGEDCNGHGTHVAGIIGSITYGVAKDVSLKAIRVFDCDNAGTVPGVIAGLDTTVALASGPSLVNLSMIGVVSSALVTALENTVAAGLSVAAAAGDNNSGACDKAPASAPSVLTVAATDMDDRQTGTSNFGDCIDIFAPGEDIPSTWLGGTTNTASGTSQAAPHVAGVMALYLEAEPGAPPLTPLPVSSVTSVVLGHGTPGVVGTIGPDTPNLLLFSDVPDNPRQFDLTLASRRIKSNGKGEAAFSWNAANIFASRVDFYVDEAPDGTPKKTVNNDGAATLKFADPVFSGPFEVQACEEGSTTVCSDIVEVEFFFFKLKIKNVFINQIGRGVAELKWKQNQVSTNKIDIYVDETPDGSFVKRTPNDGFYKLKFDDPDAGPFDIQACEKKSTTTCSNVVTADFSGAVVIFEPNPYEEEPDEEDN